MDNPQNFRRTGYCGTFTAANIGQEIAVCGWVQRQRNLGGLIFVDLRDRTGLLQLSFDDSTPRDLFEKAASLRGEYVIAAKGLVRERESKNPDLPTGDIEVKVTELRLLAKAATPPFEIVENSDVKDAVRLKYRYLDLRRPDMQRMIALRHKIVKICRDYFDEQGFWRLKPPSSPSSARRARDYLVPSRSTPGSSMPCPSAPQQYKQLLMLAGFDRYFQIARCFRDEDLRADRQPEFTQIDLEMSFLDEEQIQTIQEGFLKRVFKEVLDVDVQTPFLRMPWREAMDRFGSDKPDLRFGFELKDISDIVKDCGFGVFSSAIEAGGSVRLINVDGHAKDFPRKKIDKLGEFVKTYRAKGLAWMKIAADGSMTSSFAKFLSEDEIAAIKERAGAKENDLLFVVADANWQTAAVALGALRCELAKRLGLAKKDDFKLLWVTEFPQFEYSEEENRLVAMHHPFTAPMDEDIPLLDTDPAKVRAKAYDIILNGCELGGGSIRIHDPELQTKMFEVLGFTEEKAKEQFGHLITAFSYGAPPHGGLAYGLDRLCMLLAGLDSIRDVIAFPKVQNASDLMMNCPDIVDDKQLDDLSIAVTRVEETPEA